jgi:hypothetical protein
MHPLAIVESAQKHVKSKSKPSPPLLSILPEEITTQIVTEVIQDIVDAAIIDDYDNNYDDDGPITRKAVVGQYRNLLLTCKLFHSILQEFNMTKIWFAPDTRFHFVAWRGNEENCPQKVDQRNTPPSPNFCKYGKENPCLRSFATEVDELIETTGNFHLNPVLSLQNVFHIFEDEISKLLCKLGRFFHLHRQSISWAQPGPARKYKKDFLTIGAGYFPYRLGKFVSYFDDGSGPTHTLFHPRLGTVESVDRDKKDNLIERTTGYLNRQIERLCIVIQVNKAKSF